MKAKKNSKEKISPKTNLAQNQIRKNAAEDENKLKSENNDLKTLGKLVQTQEYELLNRIIAMEEKIEQSKKSLKYWQKQKSQTFLNAKL